MTSLSSIVSTANSAIVSRPATTSASDALQSLFAKLHMDALGSATSTSATAASAASSGSTSGDAVTGIVSGLRSVFDGAMTAAKTARSAAKLAATYGSGVGMAGLAMQAVDKLA